ncbi:MAG: cation:proton antiporter [Candidatus Woesearchaeota archaeon]
MNWDILIFVAFLVIGYLSLIVSRKFHLPEPLILVLLGIAAKFFVNLHLGIIILLCIILLLFDAGSHFIPRKFDAHSVLMGEFIIYSIIINSLISAFLFYLLIGFSIEFVILSIISGCLITTCSQFEILKMFKIKKNRLYNLTQLEEHLSNPIAIVFCILLISLILELEKNFSVALLNTLNYFIIDIALGIVLGLLSIFIVVKLLKRSYFRLSAVILSFFCYFLANKLGGSGFLSVIVLSLFFHNIVSKIPDMDEFDPLVRNIVYIFVYIALGYMITFNLTIVTIALLLYLFYILFRFILLKLFFYHHHTFLTLDSPKGTLAISIALLFMILLPNYTILFSSLLLFFIISILISYIINLVFKDIVV